MPYFYLYDTYLQGAAYAPQLIRLENTLTDLGLQGRVGRLTLLKSVKDLVANAIREGADTIVGVGNDITFSRIAEVVAPYNKITIGLIPLGAEQQNIPQILGIPLGILACQVLSSRIIASLDLGKINNQYFIQSISVKGKPNIECNGNYKLQFSSPQEIKVCNLDFTNNDQVSDPQNNFLEMVIKNTPTKSWLPWSTKKSNDLDLSIIPTKSIRLTSPKEDLSLLVDNHRIIKTPANIVVAEEKIKVIVGKRRLF